ISQTPTNGENTVTIGAHNLGTAEQARGSAKPTLILHAEVNPDNFLTITGRNFGTGSPIVNLDGDILTVSSSDDTQIIAHLPGVMAPGIHTLTVRSGPESMEFGAINIELGAKELGAPQDIPGPAELRIVGMRQYDLGHFAAAQTLLDRAMV